MSRKPDLPYCNDLPVGIAPLGWLAVLISVVAAFILLTTLPFSNFPLNFIPAIVFTGLPLLTLAVVTGGRHGVLFGRVGLKELALAIGFGLLTIAVSIAVGSVLIQLVPMTANPSTAALKAGGAGATTIFLVRTFIQLIGEELMTILPLLAVLWLCTAKLGLSRGAGLLAAVIVSTLWFAAVHLPTYNWNIVQCFAGIGAARLVLTAAFLVTRKLSVSAGAHIVNDWTEFLLPTLLAGGHTPIDPGA